MRPPPPRKKGALVTLLLRSVDVLRAAVADAAAVALVLDVPGLLREALRAAR